MTTNNTTTSQIVYVVDDDQGMLDSLVWLLDSVGIETRPFTSGQSFLEQCDASINACVLLDIRMPGMGGLNVLEAMRQRQVQLPVIFISGHADVPLAVRAFKAGACDFLEKPINEQLLLDSVQQALQSHAAQRQRQQQLASIQARLADMTPRESDLLLPLAKGFSNREIAEQLDISVKTVDLYRARVMKKLAADSLPELVAMVIATGMLDPLAARE
ncbi:response regulator transcription factor [Pokkaliibacter plantistimulans]|uniref:response regulator transcription factor n=1 Tax=Pokkaliibacter plantistimulans TaxID=1635171 RepID=UPI0024341E8D|nr:response regulator [Pokkaliibacter plantistimulans]